MSLITDVRSAFGSSGQVLGHSSWFKILGNLEIGVKLDNKICIFFINIIAKHTIV